MSYRNLPGYGGASRPRQLNVVYTREVPLRRPVQRLQYNTAWQPAPAARPRQPRSFKWPLLTMVIGALFAFAVFHGFSGKENVARAAFEGHSSKAAAVQTISEEEQHMEAYKRTISTLISAHPNENVAVSTVDLSNNQELTLGDQGTFTGASTAKLITAITLLHQVEQGKASLSKYIDGQKAGTLLQNMIVNSDNTAWQSLNNDYLSHSELKAYMSSLGLIEYDPDVNTFQPSDMARLMQKLYEGQLLDKAHTDLLLSYMQQANKREYIVDSVPAGYTVYHKAGWLDGLMHDVAIISDGKKTIVLAIYTYTGDSQGDNPTNQELFKQITTAALRAYF